MSRMSRKEVDRKKEKKPERGKYFPMKTDLERMKKTTILIVSAIFKKISYFVVFSLDILFDKPYTKENRIKIGLNDGLFLQAV